MDASVAIAQAENRRGRREDGMSMIDIAGELSSYKMPPTYIGEPIIWFRHGQKARPIAAFCARFQSASQNIDVLIPTESEQTIESVPHISDPRLKLGVEQMENGAWDYSEGKKQAVADRHALEDRLAKIESLLNSIAGPARKKTEQG